MGWVCVCVLDIIFYQIMGFPGDSVVKECQETQVQPLGGKDSLKKEMATRSSILAWEIPWIEEPGRL